MIGKFEVKRLVLFSIQTYSGLYTFNHWINDINAFIYIYNPRN